MRTSKQAGGSNSRKRIWLKCGKVRRKFVLYGGPVPHLNDVCVLNGQDWLVYKIEDVEILAQFSTTNGKLRQVFP